MTRDYTKGDLTVHWDSSRCIHTGICLRDNPEVFDVRRRPWVDVGTADQDAIVGTVEKCPTGALSYSWVDDDHRAEDYEQVEVQAVPGGPLFVRGDIHLRDERGRTIDTAPRVALCRCGATSNAPLCDGSHRQVPRAASGAATR